MKNITKYQMEITQHAESELKVISLIYSGNENMAIIQSWKDSDTEGAIQINVPRHIMECFLEMIKSG
jgi:hypothetical protein